MEEQHQASRWTGGKGPHITQKDWRRWAAPDSTLNRILAGILVVAALAIWIFHA